MALVHHLSLDTADEETHTMLARMLGVLLGLWSWDDHRRDVDDWLLTP